LPLQICGRRFSQPELDWIRYQVESRPDVNRVQLSRMFCSHVGWIKPDGGLKEMSCRVAMLRLERSGLIRLPEPKKKQGVVKGIARTLLAEPKADIHLQAGEAVLSLEAVDRQSAPLFNELIDRYHYLGYRRTGGAQMRFFVHAKGEPVALLAFSAAAWRVAPRDEFIGWTEAQRKSRLHLIVDNSRFLLLPWVHGKNLASRILSLAARKLPDFWQQRYNYRPLLLETFIEAQRFCGTCYKAANWICVGRTQGRGKWDRRYRCAKPVKTIWVYPLDRRFKEALCR
jgi:hypothetical protein